MRCPNCKAKNQDTAKICRKCGAKYPQEVAAWSPTWKWHAKTLGIIYLSLIGVYFLLNWFLKPYMREIPPEVTPWLKAAGDMHR